MLAGKTAEELCVLVDAAAPVAARQALAREIALAYAWGPELAAPPSFFAGLALLSFASCPRASPALIVEAAAAAGSALLGLDLSSCFALEDAHVDEIVRACPRLRYLCVQDCRRLTDGALAALAARAAALRHLDLGGCAAITRAGIVAFLERHAGARRFTGLGLSGTEGLDADMLSRVAATCTALERLSVGYYSGGDAALVAALRANAGTLVALDVHWPRGNVSETAILALTDDALPLAHGSSGVADPQHHRRRLPRDPPIGRLHAPGVVVLRVLRAVVEVRHLRPMTGVQRLVEVLPANKPREVVDVAGGVVRRVVNLPRVRVAQSRPALAEHLKPS
jgi:hypothetical protein